jgi:hypothetical protein
MTTTNMGTLLGALHGIPRLPGALCRGRHWLFDDPDMPDEALALCRRCPELAGCVIWFESLPPKQRPSGVTRRAGQQTQGCDALMPRKNRFQRNRAYQRARALTRARKRQMERHEWRPEVTQCDQSHDDVVADLPQREPPQTIPFEQGGRQ